LFWHHLQVIPNFQTLTKLQLLLLPYCHFTHTHTHTHTHRHTQNLTKVEYSLTSTVTQHFRNIKCWCPSHLGSKHSHVDCRKLKDTKVGWHDVHIKFYEIYQLLQYLLCMGYDVSSGVEGVVRGLEGIHLVDRCVLTRLE
jgi:hypothetical protein